MNTQIKPSDIYFRGASAAKAALPPDSLALFEKMDREQFNWTDYSKPAPDSLKAAWSACDKDPLVAAALAIRALGNAAFRKERGL